MDQPIRKLKARAESHIDHQVELLLKEITGMVEKPDEPFSYRIEQIDTDGDSVRFEHVLTQEDRVINTHDNDELFDIGLMFLEELNYVYGVDWHFLEFFFQTTNDGDKIWNLHINGEPVLLL